MPEENTVHLNPMSREDSDLHPGQGRIHLDPTCQERAYLDPVLAWERTSRSLNGLSSSERTIDKPMPEENTVHLNPMSGEDNDLDPGLPASATPSSLHLRPGSVQDVACISVNRAIRGACGSLECSCFGIEVQGFLLLFPELLTASFVSTCDFTEALVLNHLEGLHVADFC